MKDIISNCYYNDNYENHDEKHEHGVEFIIHNDTVNGVIGCQSSHSSSFRQITYNRQPPSLD